MQQDKIRAYTLIRYKLQFSDANGSKTSGIVNRADIVPNRISLTDHFLDNIALNYPGKAIRTEESTQRTTESALLDNRSYLIITTDTLLDAAERFAEWKRTKGMQVIIESREHWISDDSVKTVIKHHYDQDSIMYVLNIGGINEVPAKLKDFYRMENQQLINYDHVTDLPYSFMDNDLISDVYVGRLPVSTPAEANIVIDKIIQYERTPPTDLSFYQNALHSTYFQDNIKDELSPNGNYVYLGAGNDGKEDVLFTVTSELIKGYVEEQGKTVSRVYYAKDHVFPLRWSIKYPIQSPPDYPDQFFNGDTIPIYLQKDPSDSTRVNWNGCASNIVDCINDGVFYVFYRDHGNEDGWYHPSFKNNDLLSLQNGEKLPVFFNICCMTGRYNTTDSCFAKMLLTKENGGCVGVFAASRESLSLLNDRLAISMFNSIWPTNSSPHVNPTYELAQILNSGMINSTSLLIDSDFKYNREIFHCFGDPSMMIYTDAPAVFSNPVVDIHDENIVVQTVEDSVRISFYNLNTKQVNSYIGNHVEYPLGNDEIVVCLDKHNYVPYIVNCAKNIYIQNETIANDCIYKGNSILSGTSVTSSKPSGDVIIQGANVKMKGKTVVLHPKTTIINSNVEINGQP